MSKKKKKGIVIYDGVYLYRKVKNSLDPYI
jgi:hypothetical protein